MHEGDRERVRRKWVGVRTCPSFVFYTNIFMCGLMCREPRIPTSTNKFVFVCVVYEYSLSIHLCTRDRKFKGGESNSLEWCYHLRSTYVLWLVGSMSVCEFLVNNLAEMNSILLCLLATVCMPGSICPLVWSSWRTNLHAIIAADLYLEHTVPFSCTHCATFGITANTWVRKIFALLLICSLSIIYCSVLQLL